MRVAFFSVSDQMGGSEAMLLQIVRELRRSRPSWDLHLILPGTGPLAGHAAALGARVVALPMPASLARLGEWGLRRAALPSVVARLVRAARDLRPYERAFCRALAAIVPDVVHSNGFKAHIVAARAREANRGLIWHMHEYVSMRPLTRVLIRRYAGRSDLIVANSRSVADDIRRITGARGRVRVIHNGVDLARFAPEGPAVDLDALSGLPPAPAGTVRVGLVATFSRWKGHDAFLRAIARLPRSARVRAYVIGNAVYDTDGSQHSMQELQALSAELGIADRVGFTGFVPTSDEVMRALDVVVHASTTPEPFGLVIAEAMACGRALVTSGTGGAAELVREGDDALIHRPGDATDLASAIGRLAADAALRARLGRAARATAVRRFDARRLADDFASAYEAAAHNASGTRPVQQ